MTADGDALTTRLITALVGMPVGLLADGPNADQPDVIPFRGGDRQRS